MLERSRPHHERALLSKARAAAAAQAAVEERLRGTKRVERASAFVRPEAEAVEPSQRSTAYVIVIFKHCDELLCSRAFGVQHCRQCGPSL